METRRFSIKTVISNGWRLYKRHWKLSFIFAGAYILIQMIESIFMPQGLNDMIVAYSPKLVENPLMIFEIIQFDHPNIQFGSVIALLIKYFIYAGIYSMMLLIMDGKKKTLSFEGYAIGFKTYWRFVVVSLLFAAFSIVGTILFIIPGIIVLLRFQYATYVVLDEDDAGIFASFRKSWQMTRGNFMRLLGFAVVSYLIYLLGVLCLVLGLIVAIPFVMLSDMSIYMLLTRGHLLGSKMNEIKSV